jgi:predicted amino acid racemase
MFLDVLRRRNSRLVEASIELHQRGELPANTFVYDLDAVSENARAIATEAGRLGLTVYAMTKQIGRNPDFCEALKAGGIDAVVAVDMADARATYRAGMRLGHLGHLVQVPRAELPAALAMRPEHLTVFSMQKVREAAAVSAELGRQQAILVRLYAPDDEFYSGHEGGFPAEDIVRVADEIDGLEGVRFAGVTTFPALLFDPAMRSLRRTHNLRTLEKATADLRAAGRDDLEINAAGTTSSAALPVLAAAGVTQVEPGHALTGTTPLHAVEDLAELPAACYVTEVSHLYEGRAFCFGGGMYVDPVFPPYRVRAVVGRDPGSTTLLDATLPPAEAIDYYGQLDLSGASDVEVGDSVVFGFRIQAFVTRAYTAGLTGLAAGEPRVAGIWTATGEPTSWPA